VWVSSDTWPGTGGALGLTQAQIAEAKATGVQPTRTGGFGYLRGPDDALVEYAGNHPAERFNHVHLYHEDPFCAQLWYQRHLHAAPVAGRTPRPAVTEADCRVPRGADRTFPALDITKSGTRKEELLVDRGVLSKMWVLRRVLMPMGTNDGLEFLINKLKESKNNAEFFDAMNT